MAYIRPEERRARRGIAANNNNENGARNVPLWAAMLALLGVGLIMGSRRS